MGSKGRLPPSHLMRRPPSSGTGLLHIDQFPPSSGFPPFDVLPPLEVLEQKIAAQSVEMDRLLTENRRFASTHVTLRQQLAAAQQDLQGLQAQIGSIKSEREQQMRELKEKISKMEAELKAGESVKMELQKAHKEAQSLVAARQELLAKAQQLNQDLQKVHVDLRQIPALLSELDALRQEYQHCRGTYEYEKKLYNDHLASLQVMEKNYASMSQEVEKLRAQLNNSAAVEGNTAYGGAVGYVENDPSGHKPYAANSYDDTYASAQARGGSSLTTSASAAASTGVVPPSSGPTAAYVPSQTGQVPMRPVYDMSMGPTSYDPQWAQAYDPQAQRIRYPYYDPQAVAPTYAAQRAGPGYDPQGGSLEMQRQPSFDPQAQRVQPPQAPQGQLPYGSTVSTARPGVGAGTVTVSGTGGYEQAQNRSGNK